MMKSSGEREQKASTKHPTPAIRAQAWVDDQRIKSRDTRHPYADKRKVEEKSNKPKPNQDHRVKRQTPPIRKNKCGSAQMNQVIVNNMQDLVDTSTMKCQKKIEEAKTPQLPPGSSRRATKARQRASITS